MMKVINWLDKNIKKMRWYDVSLVKMSVLFWTFFLITAWTGFREVVLAVAWYWHLVIAIILMIPLLKKMFFSRK